MTAFAVTGTTRDGSRVDVTQQADARSADQSVATVAHGQGSQILINAVAQGSTTITVTVGSLQQTCAVTVTFAPAAVGSRPAGVTITDDAAGNPHSVALSGTGSTSAVAFDKSLGKYNENIGSSTLKLTTIGALACTSCSR